MRAGFILSHPFQYQFFAPIASRLAKPHFIVERRAATPFEFTGDFLASLPGITVQIDSKELAALDGLLDVLFCMTPVHVMAMMEKTKMVCLQYSLAKEVYQHGVWRCLADLNIMQGDYSYQKINGFAVSDVGGNPRYDFKRGETGGSGLLYMPTYGELSSLGHFIEALPSLPEALPIKVKLHHASEFADVENVARLRAFGRVEILDGYTDALPEIQRSDVVLSDYSGAIFDALALGRPVALLQPEIHQTKIRTDAKSIEIARAHEIGPIATDSEGVADAVSSAIRGGAWSASRQALIADAVGYLGSSADRIEVILSDLLAGKYEPTLVQRDLRQTHARYIEENRSLRLKIKQRESGSKQPSRAADSVGKTALRKSVVARGARWAKRNLRRWF